MKIFISLLISISLAYSANVAATIVNLDARLDAGNSPQTLFLEAGTYDITPIIDTYTAFSSFIGIANSWRHAYAYSTPEIGEFFIGTPNVSCGVPGTCFNSASEAFNAHATASSFSLTSAANVDFFICDGAGCFATAGDNRGGVSLDVNAVPVPGAVWFFGTSIVGLFGFTRKKLRFD